MTSDDIKAAIQSAEQEIPVTIPRWMVSHVADLCSLTAARHSRKAAKGTATARSNKSLAESWENLAASLRLQRDAQRDTISTNEVRIDITQDGVYLVNAPAAVSVVIHDYTASHFSEDALTDDAGYNYQRVNLTVDGESV